MRSTDDNLYSVLEEILKASKEPLDCNELFDNSKVRKHARTVNRVSDYLGNMWRKGDVVRVPAPLSKNSRSRWLYAWKGRVLAKPTLDDIKRAAVFASDGVQNLLKTPQMEITQEGKSVVITLPDLIITIKQK